MTALSPEVNKFYTSPHLSVPNLSASSRNTHALRQAPLSSSLVVSSKPLPSSARVSLCVFLLSSRVSLTSVPHYRLHRSLIHSLTHSGASLANFVTHRVFGRRVPACVGHVHSPRFIHLPSLVGSVVLASRRLLHRCHPPRLSQASSSTPLPGVIFHASPRRHPPRLSQASSSTPLPGVILHASTRRHPPRLSQASSSTPLPGVILHASPSRHPPHASPRRQILQRIRFAVWVT